MSGSPIGHGSLYKCLCGGEVRGSNPTDSITFYKHTTNQFLGCHVVAHDWATWHHAICPKFATCHNMIRSLSTNKWLPHHQLPCQCTSNHVTCTDMPHHHPYGLYGLPSQHPVFFTVWRFRQIAISLAPDVRLRRNELRWIRDDEGYTLVCFEEIPRMFIFGLKFDP